MRRIVRSLAGATATFLAASANAGAADRCTQDTLTVEGNPVVVGLCASQAEGGRVTVSETFSRGGASITRTLPIDVVNGAAVARGVDDVPLNELGSTKRLRVTVSYRGGTPTLEHALLLPGALVLK